MGAGIGTRMIEPNAFIALLQLSSPALPIGAFSYSQGLESAVCEGLVTTEEQLQSWVAQGLEHSFGVCELPVWVLQYRHWSQAQVAQALTLDQWFRAARETQELLQETEQMGWAALALLRDLSQGSSNWTELLNARPVALPTVMAALAVAENIPLEQGALAYAFAWVEAQVSAGGKAIPLGQASVQRILRASRLACTEAVRRALTMQQSDLQTLSPGLAILSSQHETQYTRLFRS
jgi:urease accessory protein